MKPSSLSRFSILALMGLAAPISAQVLDLTVHNVGLAIGDKPEMTGLQLNYRDRALHEGRY